MAESPLELTGDGQAVGSYTNPRFESGLNRSMLSQEVAIWPAARISGLPADNQTVGGSEEVYYTLDWEFETSPVTLNKRDPTDGSVIITADYDNFIGGQDCGGDLDTAFVAMVDQNDTDQLWRVNGSDLSLDGGSVANALRSGIGGKTNVAFTATPGNVLEEREPNSIATVIRSKTFEDLGTSGPSYCGGNDVVVYYSKDVPGIFYDLDYSDLSIVREANQPGGNHSVGGTENVFWYSNGSNTTKGGTD